MSVPFLPKLIKGNSISISKKGEWQCNEQNTLDNLAQDLSVPADEKSDITSIPDLWARPLLYVDVLTKENHPQYERFYNEWCGVLSILALRDVKAIKGLKTIRCEIPEERAADYIMFKKTLAARKSPNSGNFVQLITFKDQPLAFIWDEIVIAPAHYPMGSKDMVKCCPWWTSKGIVNPLLENVDAQGAEKGSYLSLSELAMIRDWLVAVNEKINEDDRYKYEKAVGLLAKFKQQIEDKLGRDYKNTEVNCKIEVDEDFSVTGVWKALRQYVEITKSEGFLHKSQVQLVKSESKKDTQVPDLLVMTPGLEEDWGVPSSEIIVAGPYTIDFVRPRTGYITNKWKVNDYDLRQHNAELRMGEDFFTDYLILVPNSKNIIPHGRCVRDIDYKDHIYQVVLPFKKELLSYLDADYFARKDTVSLKVNQDNGTVRVDLKLPVTGNGDSHTIRISAVYSFNEDCLGKRVFISKNMPFISVWPNFVCEDESKWQEYYSCFDDRLAPKKTFYAQPNWSEAELKKKATIRTYRGELEIVAGRKFPKEYICYARPEGGSKNVEAGFILLSDPDVIITGSEKKCTIGVDFGTTNTVAYINMDNRERPLSFSDRIYPVVEPTSDNEILVSKQRKRQFTIPSDIIKAEDSAKLGGIYRSLFHWYKGASSNALFSTGNVYYPESADSILSDATISNAITSDLKWSGEANTEFAKTFLEQFAHQCVVEALAAGATQIEWKFSYPEAFTKAHLRRYRDTWHKVLTNLRSISTAQLERASRSDMSMTESEAMARYFKKAMEADISHGIICFDIGGGSTDIVIWEGRENNIRCQCSFRLAGKKILNEYLKKKRNDVLNLFKSSEEGFATDDDYMDSQDTLSELIEELRDEDIDDERFNIILETMFKYHEDEIFRKLDNTEFESVAAYVTFGLAGMFYYMGMVLGMLIKKGIYTQAKKYYMPYCYLGGNGSKLLIWAAKGNFYPGCAVDEVLQAMLIAGRKQIEIRGASFVESDIQICMSKKPKQEVAYGLVCNKVKLNAQREVEEEEVSQAFAGEEYCVGDGEEQTDLCEGIITAQDIMDGVTINGVEPRVFSDFVAAFNKAMKEAGFATIDLSDDYVEIVRKVDDQLNEIANQAEDPEEVEVEPLFICILRKALEIISAKVEKKK